MDGHLNRYRPMIADLARRALDMPVPPPPHRPRAGEERFKLSRLRDTARALLGEPIAPSTLVTPPPQPHVKFVDGFGHHRPVYRHLGLHLHQTATGQQPVIEDEDAATDIALLAWSACRSADPDAPVAWLSGAAASSNQPAPLHPQSLDDGIDHWTYRELVALHALDHLAQRRDDDALRHRVHLAALYHTHHTQPDYTTCQPWGMAAFLRQPDTASLAEQQLHDVATHLGVEGGRGSVLPGLLLADAWAALE